MALLIERRPFWHIGFQRSAPADEQRRALWQLNIGLLAIVAFRGSFIELLSEWKQVADNSVIEQVDRWIAAETAGKDIGP